jgi:outer membrane protein assembly factor BamD
VARYYLKRGAYLAAVNRAQTSIQIYPQAPANEDALVVCIEAYEKMGMNDLAKDAQRVLAKNFPKNAMVSNTVGNDSPWWKFW